MIEAKMDVFINMKAKKIKIKAKMPNNTDKKSGFKPKAWAMKLIKEHKVLMDALKDR